MKGKKLYSFWLVWPQDKSAEEEKSTDAIKEEDSDDDLDHKEEGGATTPSSALKESAAKQKDLKSVCVHLYYLTMNCLY